MSIINNIPNVGATPASGSQYTPLESGAMGAVNGATLGAQNKAVGAAVATADSIGAGLNSVLALIGLAGSKKPNQTWSQTYQQVHDSTEAAFNQAQSDNPKSYVAGQVAGALSASAAMPEGAVAATLRGIKGVASIARAADVAGAGASSVVDAAAPGAARVAGSVSSWSPTTVGGLGKRLLVSAGKGIDQGATQGAAAGAASQEGGGLQDKLTAAGTGAVAGATTGSLVGAGGAGVAHGLGSLAEHLGPLGDVVAGGGALGAASHALGALKKPLPPIAVTGSNVLNPVVQKGLATSGQLAGQAAGSGQSTETDNGNTPADDNTPDVDVNTLLKQLGIDPKSADGVQKADQVNPPDYTDTTADADQQPGTALSPDVPQVTVNEDGQRILTVPGGQQVELT